MNCRLILLALPALLMAGPAAAEAYKCRAPDGRLEITNAPCSSGTNTVKAVPDDTVSEERRQAAERDAARMRDYVEKSEARQRAEEAAEREERKWQPPAPVASQPSSVETCLANLDRQALTPMQRAQMEASCRGTTPVYVPVPVVVRSGPSFPHRPHHPQPPQYPPVQQAPTLERAPTIAAPCIGNARNCGRR